MSRTKGLSEREQELIQEAYFTGPPEEDSLREALCNPFNKNQKKAEEHHHRTEKERDFLKLVVEYEAKDPAILWFGLFTDLIFVAVIVQFANQYKYFFKYKSSNAGGSFYARITFETILFFFAFFTIWMELAQANVRFVNVDGAVDDLLYFAYLCGVIIMAVQMSPEDYLLDHNVGFMAGLLICLVSILALHVTYYQCIPRSQEYCVRRFYSYGIAIILITVGLIMGASLEGSASHWCSAVMITLACSVICLVSFISFRVDKRYYNWSFDYFEERFGVLVMIVTGESILALMLGSPPTDMLMTSGSTSYYYNSYDYSVYAYQGAFLQLDATESFKETVSVIVAFATMYILKNIYFDSEAEFDHHALNEAGTPGSVVWVFMHFPLTFSLLGCGVGYKLMFTSIHEDDCPLGYRLILGCCVALSIISMLVIRAAHDKFLFPIKSMLIRIPTALLVPVGCVIIKGTISSMLFVLAGALLSWIYDLTIMDGLELKKYDDNDHGHGHADTHHEDTKHQHHHENHRATTHHHNLQHEPSGPWDWFLTICGLHDKEYAGAFHGPKHEADPRLLCIDVAFCSIWSESRSAKDLFPPEYVNEISHPHGHGHGHGDGHGHGHFEEAGVEHGWFGVFTDLIFVAVIIKFADQMKYKQSSMNQLDADLVKSDWDHARIYIEAAVYFGAFFICWIELQHLLIRFTNMPGIFDDIMYFLYLSGVIGMAIQMNHLEYLFERRQGFCAWFAFTLACLVVLHIKLSQIDVAETYCYNRIVTFGFSTILVIIASFLEETSCAILLVISYMNCLWISLNSFRVWEESKPDAHLQFEYIERFGLIIMITTGESILALVIADFEQDVGHYVIIMLAFVTMYIFKTIYFDSHSETPDMHALAEGHMPGAVMWAFLHLPAAFFLLGCGVGYKMVIAYAEEPKVDAINRYTLGFSITGALCSIYMIRAAHTKFILPPRSVIVRFGSAALAPVGAIFIESPIGYVSWCCGVLLVSWGLDLFLIHYGEWEIHEDYADHERHGFYKEELHDHYTEKGGGDTHEHGDHGHHEHTRLPGDHPEKEMVPMHKGRKQGSGGDAILTDVDESDASKTTTEEHTQQHKHAPEKAAEHVVEEKRFVNRIHLIHRSLTE